MRLIGSLVLAVVLVSALVTEARTRSPVGVRQIMPAIDNARRVALELRLTPESLVVADLSGQVQALLAELVGQAELMASVDQRRSEMATVAALVRDRAERCQDINENREAAIVAYREAVALLRQATAAHASACDALFEAVVESVPKAKASTLRVIRDQFDRKVPIEFKIVTRTGTEWRLLEKAVKRKARADRLGEELDQTLQDALAEPESNADILAARQRLSRDLSSVQQAFDAFSVE